MRFWVQMRYKGQNEIVVFSGSILTLESTYEILYHYRKSFWRYNQKSERP